ncbi:hypothetical protein LBMAG42_49470 [Deltaproteobacteria bacterium]|nr:hypothetical protein LBMAG42_49470 [Deltaproteobacteria bacterium]
MQKPLTLTPIAPPPPAQRVGRNAAFVAEGARRDRYTLPEELLSASPSGYRTRPSFTREEAHLVSELFALESPSSFIPGAPPTEGELFDEAALGVLSARQSTNYRGHRQVTVGPEDSARIATLLRKLEGLDRLVLNDAAYTHVGLSRPYRTPFTFLLTFIGHKTFRSLLTVPQRAWNKKLHHVDDIPTIGFLQHLHVGIWADAMERAALIASNGARRANVVLQPFSGPAWQTKNAAALAEIETIVGLTEAERRDGWRIALVGQVGAVAAPSPLPGPLCRKLGAALMSLRSERIQPGVNAEDKAPAPYQARQDMDVSAELTEMAGRAAYNAFCHWTGVDREVAKHLLLMERIDVLTDGGKERLRTVRRELEEITDKIVRDLPLWADLPMMRALSKNAARGKKAFALAGQRIYVGGLSRTEVEAAGVDFHHAVRAFGAAAARSALVCELSGCIDIPEGCDLLAGICLMAGPVNQNDVGKQFHGYADLLAGAFPGRDPTSLLVWTLKAKTVADPIGNEEQLMNASRKGALVDLRAGPHEVVSHLRSGKLEPMRARDERVNTERAFADADNFVTDAEGREIPGNRGSAWPAAWRAEKPWA